MALLNARIEDAENVLEIIFYFLYDIAFQTREIREIQKRIDIW